MFLEELLQLGQISLVSLRLLVARHCLQLFHQITIELFNRYLSAIFRNRFKRELPLNDDEELFVIKRQFYLEYPSILDQYNLLMNHLPLLWDTFKHTLDLKGSILHITFKITCFLLQLGSILLRHYGRPSNILVILQVQFIIAIGRYFCYLSLDAFNLLVKLVRNVILLLIWILFDHTLR